MEITIQADDRLLTVALSGRLDTNTVRELESVLKEQLNKAAELVFDLNGLQYLSSAGLRVLLGSHKRMGGRMRVLNACPEVRDIFTVTGMINILNIE